MREWKNMKNTNNYAATFMNNYLAYKYTQGDSSVRT